MSIFIPPRLLAQIPEFGEAGVEWVQTLAERVERLERGWGLRVGAPFDHGGATSWVAPATLDDGRDVVLKIAVPHEEAEHEAAALRVLDGAGAVKLIRCSEDGFSLLLERCVPGEDLWSIDQDEADEVACGLLPQILRFADRLQLDPARIAGWAFAKTLYGGGEPEVIRAFHQAGEL